jgi:hypothetical protein
VAGIALTRGLLRTALPPLIEFLLLALVFHSSLLQGMGFRFAVAGLFIQLFGRKLGLQAMRSCHCEQAQAIEQPTTGQSLFGLRPRGLQRLIGHFAQLHGTLMRRVSSLQLGIGRVASQLLLRLL